MLIFVLLCENERQRWDTCDICKSVIKDNVNIPDTKGEKYYNVIKDATCKDINSIFALFCKRCAKTVYVGETERTLKERTI